MKKFKIGLASTVLALVALTGCKKFVDVNNDPNNNLVPKVDLIMTGALGTTYRNQASTNVTIVPGTWTGIYAHSTSFTGGGNDKTYEYTSADYNAFSGLFDNLADYDYVIKNADASGFSYWKEPADVMQCYVFQQLVDMYGDVPYTDAFKGVSNITPKYTNQQTIYEDLVDRLDSSMDRMARKTWPTSTDFTSQDIMFALNKTSWIQFANTVKLRILMRQSMMGGTRDAYIQQKFATRAANGFLTSNVLIQPGYQNISGKLNPFYANFGYNEVNNVQSNYQYRKMNAVVINYLKTGTGAADTFRLQGLAYPSGSTFTGNAAATSITGTGATVASYVGVPLGAGSGFATASCSPIGAFQVQVGFGTRAGMLMLAAESYFLQAEYAAKYNTTVNGASAQTLYETGIRSHFRTVAAPSTAGTAANAVADGFCDRYLLRPAVAFASFTTADARRSAILRQKWLSLTHINGLEQWAEYRKVSGQSVVTMVPASVRTTASTSNPEPVRYVYPQTEFDNNSLNVPQNINRFTTKLFWDVN
ncbi:SusD/RagB family nutrient-binding outer membrane lipoprotein [Ferruginibacter yonginensis]|uniref:SusD/RagB family nutrient-binding outer membrane lipoprotein n=1 Tax=Ferruginibacter yonginensis TaxID=1310416 RepID=A0ABV8QPN4_9BACT